MFVDLYFYFFLEEFVEDLFFVMECVCVVGVMYIFMFNIDSMMIEFMLLVCDIYWDFCFLMIGLYFIFVNEFYEKEFEIVVVNLEIFGWFVVVGEIGIDFYWDKIWLKEQLIVFEK